MKKTLIHRRSFLKAAAYGVGALAGTRLLGRGGDWEGEAKADNETPALLMVYLRGGYNALFSAAGGLKGSFGVSDGNIEDRGNGLVIDAATFGTLPELAKSRMATIGVAHGLTDHDDSQQQKWWAGNDRSYVLSLADALGGDGAIKAAIVGDDSVPGSKAPVNGVTLQTIADMDATIAALGASANDPASPSRAITAAALDRAAAMSKAGITANPQSLASLDQAYPTASSLLRKAQKPFSFQSLSDAYQLDGSTNVDDWKSRMAAAELMVTAGANVVIAVNDDWDSHGDTDGSGVRDHMNSEILPPLTTFLNNMWADPTRNVVVAIMGDFARSLPGSDHQPNCAVTVLGKYVKGGSTGNVDQDVNMADGTPDCQQLWAYLAAVLKSPTAPFGPNPHALVV